MYSVRHLPYAFVFTLVLLLLSMVSIDHWLLLIPTPVQTQSRRIQDDPVLDQSDPLFDPNTVPLCRRDQIRSGKWVERVIDSPPYWYAQKSCALNGTPAPNRSLNYNNTAPYPFRMYRWEPNDQSCRFLEWNTTQFCQLMQHSTVLVVGDSLSFEHYHSLAMLNHRQSAEFLQMMSWEERKNVVLAVCEQNTRLAYRRADALENLTEAIQETFPSILILNRGAHFVSNEQLAIDMQQTIEAVRIWQDQCQQLGIQCLTFWRTTVPGHPMCSAFDRPINDLDWMENWIANNTVYNWAGFKQQNQMILKQWEDARIPNVHIIDAYEINIVRPDQHVGRFDDTDCLHSCYPGKMDVYSQILLHYLSHLKQKEDSERLRLLYPTRDIENVRVYTNPISGFVLAEWLDWS